jgi:hypothetical protein
MKKTVTTLMFALALAVAARAQGPDGGARAAVAALPDSQAVLYVNARRVTNDALPRLLPAAQLDKFFADAQQNVRVDLRAVEYVVLAARYDVNNFNASAVPDFGVTVRGGFNADALLSFLRLAQPGQYRAETHGDKKIDVYKIDFEGKRDDAAPAPTPDPEKPQPMKLPGEFAVVDLALRNPDALVSLTGDLPPNLSKFFEAASGMAGRQNATAGLMNDEIRRLADSLRQLQLSISMTPAEFSVQTTVRTERPEDARSLSGLVDFGVAALEQGINQDLAKAKTAKARADARKLLAVVKSLGNNVSDRDLTLSLSVSRATAADFVREMAAPPKPAARAPRRGAPARRRR